MTICLETLAVLVLAHLLAALLNQRTQAGETSLLEMWSESCGTLKDRLALTDRG